MAVRFEEHVGEVSLRIEAPSLARLFEEAALALCELTAGTNLVATGPYEEVVVNAPDREALLVEWLNELVYRSEARKCVYPSVRVDRIDDCSLSASLCAVEPRVIRTAVKAATMHDLEVRRVGDGWTARVVLDV